MNKAIFGAPPRSSEEALLDHYDLRQLRFATSSDIPALRQLIEASVRGLSAGYYNGPQIKSAP